MAQVDYSFIDVTSGASACPSGQDIRTGISLVDGSLTTNEVRLLTWSVSITSIHALFPETRKLQSAPVYLSVLENGNTEVRRQTLGTAKVGTDVAADPKTFSTLKQNTRYTAVTHIGDVTRILSRFCFKTAADLEIPFGSGRGGDGPGDSWSSGCFAFSTDRNEINACLCGARNASGAWARTDAEDGYEYIRDATWRTSAGCTTN